MVTIKCKSSKGGWWLFRHWGAGMRRAAWKWEEAVFAHGYERRKMQGKGKGREGKERKIYSELKGVEGIEVFQ